MPSKGAKSSKKNNANKIVEANKGKDIKDMLKAYQEKICDLTSYNDIQREKYNSKAPDIDLNAWQPFYVFDDNANTSVVCEGYSKAFQYLCDESNIKCYTVSGKMAGGTGEGDHMWNIVVIDGKSYLVDVTNS